MKFLTKISKKPGCLQILTCSKISVWQFFCHDQNIKNTFKEALRYLFNVIILLNTFCYLKPNFKLKIDSKRWNFKNWKKFEKSEKFAKTSDNTEKNLLLPEEKRFKAKKIDVYGLKL